MEQRCNRTANTAPYQAMEPTDGLQAPKGMPSPLKNRFRSPMFLDMLTVKLARQGCGDITEGFILPQQFGGILLCRPSVNTHNISKKVTDEVGETCTATINYTVGTPQNITIDTPVDGDHSEGDAITFSATVSDAQDQPDEIALDWKLNGTSFQPKVQHLRTAQWSDSLTLALGR